MRVSTDAPSHPSTTLDSVTPADHASAQPAILIADSSALDIDEATATSLQVLTSDRVRRRSEVLPKPAPGFLTSSAVEEIELPALSPIPEGDVSAVSFLVDGSLPSPDAKDVEMAPSFPSSLAPSIRNEAETSSVAPVLSASQKAAFQRKGWVHFLSLCLCVFGMGWNDGATGPLLPTIQRHYHIGFAIVSMIFVFNTIGYIVGAVANVYLSDRFGFGKVLLLGTLCPVVAYLVMIPGGPFPLMWVSFLFIGFGMALQNAHANAFVGSLSRHAKTKMGFLHAAYGFGALLSPLVATQFAKSDAHWSHHYITSVCLYAVIGTVTALVFRGRHQAEVMADEGEFAEPESQQTNKYQQIFRIKEVHFMAVFALIYVGVEVTVGGWTVTFIEQKRGGGSNSGYISSGFFGGLMLGRILLLWLNKKIGERLALFVYALLALAFEVTVWVVPSLIENAVAVALVGLLLGPMYPILMNHSTTILPRWLLTGSMGLIAGVGQAGSAVLPFVTGLLASKFGIASLQPFIVSMMSTMIVIWALIPRARHVD